GASGGCSRAMRSAVVPIPGEDGVPAGVAAFGKVRTLAAARACFVLVSSAVVRTPGERWLNRSVKSCACLTAAASMSVAGSAAIDQARGIPSAAQAHAASTSERLRRRLKASRTARDRRTARETDWLDTARLLTWFNLQLRRSEQLIEPKECQSIN